MNKFLHIASHPRYRYYRQHERHDGQHYSQICPEGKHPECSRPFRGKTGNYRGLCDESSTFAGKRIRDLKLPHNTLIVFISHGSENIIPTGDYMIEQGDNIVLITNKEAIKRLDKMLDNRS